MSNKKTNKVFSDKKGQIAGLSMIPAVVAAIVVGFVFLSIGASVVGTMRDNAATSTCIVGDNNANCSASYNASDQGLAGLLEFSSMGTTIGLVSAAVIVLTLLAVGLGSLVFNR